MADAVSLIKAMLQKTPSQRPSLIEVLSHPFLAEHAPAQRAILALTQPPAFTTRIEKDCLHRMKSAGVDIDQVIENVLAKKCDALAGWWALMIEKEERKERRRQKRKIESRRMSAASNLEALLPPMVAEEHEPEESKKDGKKTENNRMPSFPIFINLPTNPSSYNNTPRKEASQPSPNSFIPPGLINRSLPPAAPETRPLPQPFPRSPPNPLHPRPPRRSRSRLSPRFPQIHTGKQRQPYNCCARDRA